ncbi:hypothetical protein GBA63_15570 [Rubrobacter tropicus]|uniref:Uncharacterized protein n=1 Tax=Rubrobacter tropicus TaxID=2653851 RepID=A0A6G8QBT8_9ACTN|nr:hypothetical protein [Rubrobacter tropicus]QIN83903.1 hypothetical protein GBA63_15570 [Rubrobacter tropicus]
MTERDRREGTGETRDNVRDDLDEASKGRRKDATPGAVEEEEATGGGGVKDNVTDDQRKTQKD